MDGDKKYYTDINSETISRWVAGGWEWGIPISHEDYIKAKRGEWGVLLSPNIKVPFEWFSPYINLKIRRLDGISVLGLASGGGQQMPIFAAIGADATVLDYSDAQLNNERIVAQREDYLINIVKADMTKTLPFEDNSFDIIFHPVSNSYVEDVYHVWNECYRVLKKGGILLAGMGNGFDYLFDDESDEPLLVRHKLPYNPLKNPEQYKCSIECDGSLQFSHTLEEQIGGQLKAGFILTDLYEDRDSSGIYKDYFPGYIVTRAVKK